MSWKGTGDMAGETSQQQKEALRTIPERWGNPDPKYLSQLPRKTKEGRTIQLDYLGHAQLRAALTAEDPQWSWAPMALNDMGTPHITSVNGMAIMWIYLTIHGKTQPGVGNCQADKPDAAKELIGDALRNAAMTFGFGLALWAKEGDLITADPGMLPTEGPQGPETDQGGGQVAEGGPSPVEAHREALKSRANSLPPGDRGTLRASIDLQGLSWSNDSDLAQIELLVLAAEEPLVKGEQG